MGWGGGGGGGIIYLMCRFQTDCMYVECHVGWLTKPLLVDIIGVHYNSYTGVVDTT